MCCAAMLAWAQAQTSSLAIAASKNRHKFPAGRGPSRGLFLDMKKPNRLGWAKSLNNMVGAE